MAFNTPTPTTGNPTPARVFLDGAGGLVSGGLIQSGGTPVVTLNDRWATYNPTNGLVPAATVDRSGANLATATATENVASRPGGATLTGDVAAQTLVLEPSFAARRSTRAGSP